MTTEQKVYFQTNGRSTPPAIKLPNPIDKSHDWYFADDCCKVEVPGYGYIWVHEFDLVADALPDQATVKYYKLGEMVPPYHCAEAEAGDTMALFGQLLDVIAAAKGAGAISRDDADDMIVRLDWMRGDAFKHQLNEACGVILNRRKLAEI